jgi:tellurite resistance protein
VDPRIDRMLMAFALQAARKIVEADDAIDAREQQILRSHFPFDRLIAEGFLNPETGRLTEVFTQARIEALGVIPQALTLEEKQDLVLMLHDVCLADGKVDPRESQVLREVAQILGLNEPDLPKAHRG